MRSLLYYVAWCEDKANTTDDETEKEKYHDLIELLIPIAKGYVTDRHLMCATVACRYTADMDISRNILRNS